MKDYKNFDRIQENLSEDDPFSVSGIMLLSLLAVVFIMIALWLK